MIEDFWGFPDVTGDQCVTGVSLVGVIQRLCDAPKKECSRTVGNRWHLPSRLQFFIFFTQYNMFEKLYILIK